MYFPFNNIRFDKNITCIATEWEAIVPNPLLLEASSVLRDPWDDLANTQAGGWKFTPMNFTSYKQNYLKIYFFPILGFDSPIRCLFSEYCEPLASAVCKELQEVTKRNY